MGNGLKKSSEVISPPSSPIPQKFSPKKRKQSPKNTSTPKTKKSSTPKVNSNKKATPEKGNRSRSKTPPSKKRRREKRISKNTVVASPSPDAAAIIVENEDVSKDGAVQKPINTGLTKKQAPKKEYPTTLDARVHRLRHMGYVPGSISAFTPTSTEDGQVVVARMKIVAGAELTCKEARRKIDVNRILVDDVRSAITEEKRRN